MCTHACVPHHAEYQSRLACLALPFYLATKVETYMLRYCQYTPERRLWMMGNKPKKLSRDLHCPAKEDVSLGHTLVKHIIQVIY